MGYQFSALTVCESQMGVVLIKKHVWQKFEAIKKSLKHQRSIALTAANTVVTFDVKVIFLVKVLLNI